MYKINREFEIERRKSVEWNRGYGDLLCANVTESGTVVLLAALRKEISLQYRAVEVEVDLGKTLSIRFRPELKRTDETTRFINYSYSKSFSITAKIARAFSDAVRKRSDTGFHNGFLKLNQLSIVCQVYREDDWYVIKPFK